MNGFIWLAVLLLVLAVVAIGVAVLASSDPEGRGGNVALGALGIAVCLVLGVVASLGTGIYRAIHPPPSTASAATSSAASSAGENSTSEK